MIQAPAGARAWVLWSAMISEPHRKDAKVKTDRPMITNGLPRAPVCGKDSGCKAEA